LSVLRTLLTSRAIYRLVAAENIHLVSHDPEIDLASVRSCHHAS